MTMSDHSGDGGAYMGWFLFGAALGAAAALLLAPKTGEETRQLLTQRSGEVAKKAQGFAAEAQGRAGEWLDKSRELFGGNNTVKEMLLAQQQSSDQWAFYQAKVIREHQYRGQKMILETQLAEPSTLKGAERAKVEALAAKFAEEEKRYNAEKRDIEKDAKKLEAARDHRRERHPYFEFGEVLLQIAIVSASVAILSTSRQMFWFSLVLAVVGAGLTVNG